jgi:hypothetical protein
MRNYSSFFGAGAISVMLLSIATAGQAFQPPPYPRIAALVIGSPQNYDDPTYQATIARTSVAVFSYWPGWEQGRTMTFEKVLENLKAANPNIQTFVYSLTDSIGYSNAQAGPLLPVLNKLDAMNWWLYPTGTSGAKVLSFWQGGGGPFYQINNTLFSPKDSNGLRWIDWYAQWAVGAYVKPNSSLDGLFTDNVFWKPRSDGDWNLDGVLDSASDPTVDQWYRQGYAAYFADLKNLMPGKLQIGNIATLGDASAVYPELNQQLNGGLMEGQIGYSWSVETWGGWQAMMASYRKIMSAIAYPQLGMFAQIGSPTDYQSMRYGLASCLMDNGYYTFDSSAAYNDLPWFDEYNVKLGVATSSPSTSAWQKGVYRRDFQNGIALVNPKGNGAQTVMLETTFYRFAGKQDPTTNNGQATTTVTLQDRDGIILLRGRPQTVPRPPAAVRAQLN